MHEARRTRPGGESAADNGYPTKAAHARAWAKLAAAIAARGEDIDDTPPAAPPADPGELIVIGSGIETVGFSLGDEELIRSADAVFYCVADPATVVWLKTLRPDAYDLYVLYDDSKVRYTTYMQMSEALLYHVRDGRRVVGVYYGHPGIFVLSTHRAIAIARREGHRAVMRPAVCALDCLCADLGVDPCHPGLQTHEATDMLIRGRVPDTKLHVVLWQVGLIGEMGFRRKGYINEGFSIFVEYLQAIYGEDYPITHYVASRYPSIEPTIETYTLQELHDPRTQAEITGVSTFYLPPRDPAVPDRAMLMRLGLLRPGQELRTSDGPLRDIDRYGRRERAAFRAFERFAVPAEYHWQEDTAASRFLIALRHDLELRERYGRNPRGAVAPDSFAGLSERERALLATRNAGAIQVAAKGSHVSSPENRALLTALFRRRPLQLDLLEQLRGLAAEDAVERLTAWSHARGHAADWHRMRTDVNLTTRDCAFAWTGIYSTSAGPWPNVNGEAAAAERLIVLTGGGPGARLSLDGAPVRRVAFRRGTFSWPAIAGRQDHGFLRVDVDRNGRRRLIGSIWPHGERVPATGRVVAAEVLPGRRHPAALVGVYKPAHGGPGRLEVAVRSADVHERELAVLLDGEPLDGTISLDGAVLRVGVRRFCLADRSAGNASTDRHGDTDARWRAEPDVAPALCGTYRLRTRAAARRLDVSQDGLLVDGAAPAWSSVAYGRIEWSGGPPAAAAGQVTLVLDPLTLHPALFGTVQTAPGTALRCLGHVPAPPDLRRLRPEFGLSCAQWQALVALAARPDLAGGLLIWHQAEKANLAATIVNRIMAPLLP